MSKHWLIEYHFARGDFTFCQKIIQENLKEDEKSEYSTRVQVRRRVKVILNYVQVNHVPF
jgi:hypothetical protein